MLLGALLAVPARPVAAATEPDDPLAALERAQQKLFAAHADKVVFLATRKGLGSGFVVSRDGLVLTNAHVVGDAKTVDVVMHDGRKLQGTVLERAKKGIDLALVQLPLAKTEPFALARAEALRVGAWVGSINHGRGAIWTFSTGMVSNIYPAGGARPVFQTEIPLNPGSSGGPIFDRHGRVVGVVTAGIEDAQAINFGIKIDVALLSLDLLASRCECLVVSAPKGVPVFVDGVLAGVGPRVVAPVDAGDHEVMAVVAGKPRQRRARTPQTRSVDLTRGDKP